MTAAGEGPGKQLRQGVDTIVVVRKSFLAVALSALAMACALVGPFLLDGVSVVLLGLILGGLGYYFGLRIEDGVGQSVGIVAVVFCVISLFVSTLTIAPQ